MKNSLNFQLKTMLNSKGFNISILIMCIYAVAVPIFYAVQFTNHDINEVPAAYSFFIGSSLCEIPNRIFYTLTPLMVAFPFADSYFTDSQNKTIYSVLSRCSKNNYYYGKLICVYISGFLVVFIPLIMNYLINFAIFPVDSTVEFYKGFGQIQNQLYLQRYLDNGGSIFFKHLFFTNQYLYEIVYLFIASFFAGLFSVIIFQFSFFYKGNRIMLNSLFFIVFNVVDLALGVLRVPWGITLDYYISSGQSYGYQNYIVFFILLTVCIIAAFAPIPLAKRKLNEII